jgi:hypothetical protein
METVGEETTVMVADPEAVPVQDASVTLVTEYVVVLLGETVRCAGDEPTDWLAPSLQERIHGPEPVRAAEIVAEPPAQMDAEPLTTAVGTGEIGTEVFPVPVQPPTVTFTESCTFPLAPELKVSVEVPWPLMIDPFVTDHTIAAPPGATTVAVPD